MLFSLLLALSIWTIHNLSLKYTSHVQYDVMASSNLEGRAKFAGNSDALIVKARTSGYTLMLRSLSSIMFLELEPKYFHQASADSDTFLVYVSEIRDILEKHLQQDDITSIENFSTEVMRFVFPKVKTKKVPVIAQTQIDYLSQHMPLSKISLKPDSVLIYGEEKYFDRVDAVYTEIISKRDVNKNFQGVAEIIPIENIDVSQSQVYYTQEVGRYIEQTIDLPLEIVNLPQERDILPLASKVTVIYRQLLSSHKVMNESDFRCVIDYNEVEESINLQVTPKLIKYPKGIYSVSFDPPYIECIMLDK